MPRDPKDLSTTSPQRTARRLGEAEDQKEPIRLRVGAGPAGPQGPAGLNGTAWYQGTTVPSAGLGNNGDFYLRTTNSQVYQKSGGAWAELVNIKGSPGEKGEKGETGASGKEGPAGSLENTDWKNSVRAATTANITIATALNPGDVLDGVTLAENDRVLVKDQTTKSQNGIWIVKATPVRAEDADAVAELSGGSTIYVEEGTRNKRRTFQIITPGNITPGTTAHEYQQLGFRDFGIVEALPTSEAVKNDRCTFKVETGVYWDLRYTGEATYPWTKTGGPPMRSVVTGAFKSTSTSYVDLTGGPTMTTPLAGEYRVNTSALLFNLTKSTAETYAVANIAGTDFEESYVRNNSGTPLKLTQGGAVKEIAKGATVKMRGRVSEGEGYWQWRVIELDPKRVG